GSLQRKSVEEALELIEIVANNQYMNSSEMNVKRGVLEVDTLYALLAQNNALSQQLSSITKQMGNMQISAVGNYATCGICGGPHEQST
ncbi:hypothetical protein PIB30_111395, partial [Stylosanthes scabra]|nr:hypothetical protein [Stylosanthes scabra]